MEDTFQLTAAILAFAAVIGFVATRLRQPLIVAFIAVGIAVGPAALGWVQDAEPLELLAEIGIAVLLFLVGLKLDLHLIRTTGPVALVTGLGQVAFTSIVGFGIALALGMDPTAALYVAVALTFSSTIIIVKLLSDKREIEELHGRIALGFLIVQDIVVVLVMIALSVFGADTGQSLSGEIITLLLSATGFLVAFVVMVKWVLPWILHRVAGSQELLLVFAVAWAVAVAAVSEWLGFSTEVGAFLAGFALASTPFREAIGASLTPLRDFLLLFFFIELGAGLDFSTIGGQIPAAILLSAFVLIGNPVIVLVIMGIMGYRKRVGFLAGLTVAQISEFSLIFVALGLQLGHIGDETVGLVTLVGVVTIGLSTYLILYSHPIYDRLEPLLSVFERSEPTKGDDSDEATHPDVIVYGYGRFGRNLAKGLHDAGQRVLVVDWDPVAATTDQPEDGLDIVFGDAEDPRYAESLPLHHVSGVVSTIPSLQTSRSIVSALRSHGYTGPLALTAHDDVGAELLGRLDAQLVLQPFSDATQHGVEQLLGAFDRDGLSER